IRDKLVTGVQTCALPISMSTLAQQEQQNGKPNAVEAVLVAGRLARQRPKGPNGCYRPCKPSTRLSRTSRSAWQIRCLPVTLEPRSEERRVGKEWRAVGRR